MKIVLFFYDERKERLLYLLLHILFFLQAFAIHLEAIFFQQIISVIIMIAIYSVALNEELSVYHDNSVTSGLDGTGVFMADCLGQFYDISW